MNVNINIERLILEGVDVPFNQRPALQMAIEAELARLIAEGGLTSELQSGGAYRHVPGSSIQLSGDSEPSTLGQQIAQSVYGGIGK